MIFLAKSCHLFITDCCWRKWNKTCFCNLKLSSFKVSKHVLSKSCNLIWLLGILGICKSSGLHVIATTWHTHKETEQQINKNRHLEIQHEAHQHGNIHIKHVCNFNLKCRRMEHLLNPYHWMSLNWYWSNMCNISCLHVDLSINDSTMYKRTSLTRWRGSPKFTWAGVYGKCVLWQNQIVFSGLN